MAEKYRTAGYWVVSDAITSADANTTKPVIQVPANTLVTQVLIYIHTLLDGGTPSIDVGDGTNDDGWIDTTDITETTVGIYGGVSAGAVFAIAGGKFYATADTIDAVIATGLTAGKAYVLAHMIPLVNGELA